MRAVEERAITESTRIIRALDQTQFSQRLNSMTKNIFDAFRNCGGVYLDKDFQPDPDTLAAVKDLLSQLVDETDADARREVVDDVVRMLEGGKPKGESVAASFGSGIAENSFIELCEETARESRR